MASNVHDRADDDDDELEGVLRANDNNRDGNDKDKAGGNNNNESILALGRTLSLHFEAALQRVVGSGDLPFFDRPWLPPKLVLHKGDDGGVEHGEVLTTPQRIHRLFSDPTECKLGAVVAVVVTSLIVVSLVVLVVQTLPSQNTYTDECQQCKPVSGQEEDSVDHVARENPARVSHCEQNNCAPKPRDLYFVLEAVAIGAFTIEYVLRLTTAYAVRSAQEDAIATAYDVPGYEFALPWRPVRRTALFVVDFMNLVDAVAILPFWIEVLGPHTPNLATVRVLRLFRLFRLMRVNDLSAAVGTFLRVFRMSSTGFVTLVIFTLFGLLVCGTLVFYAERGSWDPCTGRFLREPMYNLDPRSESPFTSIPASLWWVLVSFTTVGYGDMFPTTPEGKVVGVFTMYLGVFLLSIPVALVGEYFSRVWDDTQAVLRQRADALARKGDELVRFLTLYEVMPKRDYFRRWRAHAAHERARQEDVLAAVVRALQRAASPDDDDDEGEGEGEEPSLALEVTVLRLEVRTALAELRRDVGALVDKGRHTGK